ncbi:MAG: PorT family protein [Acidobacteria bacterium]|nr:PorT family protein [Acidobacteriota bacterium]
MKKLIVVLMAVLCVAALAPRDLSAGVGLKAGLSLAKFSLTGEMDGAEWKYLPSWVAGAYLEFKLGFVSVQPEVLYTRMGAKIEEDIEGVPFSLKYQFDYVQVPVLLKFNVVPAGPVRPFLYAGGYGGYLLKAKGVMEGGGESDEADLTENFERFDYGVVGGLGLAFKLPGLSLSVEGRYNYGLANFIKDPLEGESGKNRSLMALVGIGF